MILVNQVLFWFSLFLVVDAIVCLVFVLVKKKEKNMKVAVLLFLALASISTALQQLVIMYGTRAGGDPSFFELYFMSLIAIFIYLILMTYVIVVFVKLYKNNFKKEEPAE